MAKLDLSGFSALTFEEQAATIASLQEQHEQAKRAKAEELYAQLEALGLPANRPTSKKPSGDGRNSPAPKYRSLRGADTWAGRGAKPKWLVAEMEETGKTLEDFLISA